MKTYQINLKPCQLTSYRLKALSNIPQFKMVENRKFKSWFTFSNFNRLVKSNIIYSELVTHCLLALAFRSGYNIICQNLCCIEVLPVILLYYFSSLSMPSTQEII